MKRHITLYTMFFGYIRPIINKLSLIVDTYLSFTIDSVIIIIPPVVIHA